MANDIEQLVLSISADTRQIQRALKRLEGDTLRSTKNVQNHFDRMGKSLEQSLGRSFSKIGSTIRSGLATLGLGIGVREAQQLVDSATRIQNALKTTGLAGEELDSVYQKLLVSAQKNAAPLESLVTLYTRAALSAKDLKISQAELLTFTDNVALSLRVSGKSAEEAKGALLQLGQALGNGVVQAEEYNSLIDGAQPLLQAVAAGLEEAGGSVSKLTRLVKAGKISSEVFFRAFEAGAPILKAQVAGAVLTISQRFENLHTALIDAAGRFNTSTGAAKTFGAAIDNLAGFVRDVNFDTLINQIGEIIQKFKDGAAWANNFGNAIDDASGLGNIGKFLTGGDVQKNFFGGSLTITSTKALQERITSAFEGAAQATDDATIKAIRAAYINQGEPAAKGDRIGPASAKAPISMKNFAPPIGAKAARTKKDDYQRETKQIADRTAALVAETEAQRQLNPYVNDYGFAVTKARTERELLTAAEDAGTKLTPALREQIAGLAEQYAYATAEAARLGEEQGLLVQRMEEIRDLGKDVMSGLISDLTSGTSAAEAFANALSKIASKLIDMGLNGLFGQSGSDNWFSRLFGGGSQAARALTGVGLFHSGGVVGAGGPRRQVDPSMFAGAPRYHKGGIPGLKPGELPAILNRGEIVLPKMPKTGGTNAPISVTYAPSYDARGASSEAVAKLGMLMAQDRAQFESRVISTIRKANKSNVKFI